MEKDVIISHLYQADGSNDWNIQTNAEHCEGVANLAAAFASEFNMANWGRMLGLMHDRGKESDGFQAYIKRSSGFDPTANSNSPKNHSYVGAILTHRLPQDQFHWLSNPIAGHHGGLYNVDELELTLTNPIPAEISQALPDIPLPLPPFRPTEADANHIVRMLFSCLVDADWLDTEKFMNHDQAAERGRFATLADLDHRLTEYRKKLTSRSTSPINALRNEIQNICEQAASLEPGFFDLSVPTGGGKTIASIIWAIKHALRFNKKRIIIAIPFTSIIVQTASVLREIFGDENVIEHHSAMNEEASNKQSQLACENWDAPIIVTTNVQLFESMYSNRPSACRKLHSVANSVVILDEAQTLPITLLQPIVDAMACYAKLFGTSFLFSTASQPIFDGERKGCNAAHFKGMDKTEIRSIIPEEMHLHEKLRRVNIRFDNTLHSYEDMAAILRKHDRVLCVVNSRRHALEIYNELSKDTEVPTFHLSRSMCSAHVLEKIQEIKKLLEDPGQAIRVVSTQLIEAGVDIDFPVVYRQLSGLDSILQASGRCNREGKLAAGEATVFSLKDDRQSGSIKFATDTMKDLISVHPHTDWVSPEAMELYYSKLYSRSPYFDKMGINDLLKNPKSCQFEEASTKFRMIDEAGSNIIVNFGEAENLIRQLTYRGPSRQLSRNLGRHSVCVPQRVFEEFRKAGVIEEVYPGFYYVPFKDQYDLETGLKTANEFEEQTFII